MRKQIIIPLIKKIVKQLNLDIIIEPSRGIYGAILFNNGKKYYVKDINFNLNLSNSVTLAKNKAATSFFLKKFGYNVPNFTMVYSNSKCERIKSDDNIENGALYSDNIGFPVILKPNSMSQGNYIFKVNNETEYYEYMHSILKECDTAQIQQYYTGNDYRLVVLGNKILSAYQRIPFHIIGNGKSTILELIKEKKQKFLSLGRDTLINEKDPRILNKLKQQKITLHSIPMYNKKIFLQDISNLSAGGETIELTDKIHPSFANLAINIARDMNLTLCGIDIITQDITKSLTDNKDYVVIEVNSSPGLDNYAYSGLKQEEYVYNLYFEIMLFIKKQYE